MHAKTKFTTKSINATQIPRESYRSRAQDRNTQTRSTRQVLGLKEWAVNVAALRKGDQTVGSLALRSDRYTAP